MHRTSAAALAGSRAAAASWPLQPTARQVCGDTLAKPPHVPPAGDPVKLCYLHVLQARMAQGILT
jgi:hypothetical protein